MSLTGRDRADGLLIMSLPVPARDLDRLTNAGVPVVLVDTRGDGVPHRSSTDDFVGGKLATQHLVDLGHRSIAFIGEDPTNPFGFTSSAQREHGYPSCSTRPGSPHRSELVRHGPHDRDVAHAADDRAPHPARPAHRGVRVVRRAGHRCARGRRGAGACASPTTLSVIGFDDIELSTYVGLTTVRQPLFDSGQLGARLLLAAVAGDTPPAGGAGAPARDRRTRDDRSPGRAAA